MCSCDETIHSAYQRSQSLMVFSSSKQQNLRAANVSASSVDWHLTLSKRCRRSSPCNQAARLNFRPVAAGALETHVFRNRYMATLFADEPGRPLQHRLALIAQHAIGTTNALVSHLEGPFWRFAGAFVKPNANLRAMREPFRHCGQAKSLIQARSRRRDPQCNPQSPMLSQVG
jgi:hypothetical protein